MSDPVDDRAKLRAQERSPWILIVKTIVALVASAALDASFFQILFAMLAADAVMWIVGMRRRRTER